MKRVLFIVFGFLGIIINQAPAQETVYDVEYVRVCLIDSIAPDTLVQFWRFSQANNPGGNVVDVTYDLSGAYTHAGTLLPCCSCLTAASDSAGVSPPGSPWWIDWASTFFILAAVFGWLLVLMLLPRRAKPLRIAYFLPMALLFAYSSLSAQSETRYDIEFECICLVDSIGPGNVVQFWRFTQSNNPGGNVVDVTYDLSSAYTPAGTVMGCNDYYLGDNVNTSGGTPGTLAIWTGTYSLGNSSVTESGGNVIGTSFSGAFRLATGTTAQAPVGANGQVRYNTTENGISAWNGAAAAWQYLPWADADNWTAGYVPFSNSAGTALTSHANLQMNSANELYVGGVTTDRGTFDLQVEGNAIFSGGASGGIAIYNATNTIQTPTFNDVLTLAASASVTTSKIEITGAGRINLYAQDNDSGDGVYILNEGGTAFAYFNDRDNWVRFGNSATATTIYGGQLGAQLTVSGGDNFDTGTKVNGGNLILRGGGGNTVNNYEGISGNVSIQVSDSTTTYTVLQILANGRDLLHRNRQQTTTGIETVTMESDTVKYRIENIGTISTSTDGSGDIVVAHGMGVTPTSVQVTVTGTTPYVVTVHTIGSTNFTVRFYDMTGAAVASTAVTATWHAKT